MITTTQDDALVIGHGSFDIGRTEHDTVTLRDGVELWVIPAIGYTLDEYSSRALIQGIPIERLLGKRSGPVALANIFDAYNVPTRYTHDAPNFVLAPPGNMQERFTQWIAARNGGPTIYQRTEEEGPTTLFDLMNRDRRFEAFINERLTTLQRTIRLFWGACASHATMTEQKPRFFSNGLAIAMQAQAYARAHPEDNHANDAAEAAFQAVGQNAEHALDTANVLNALTQHDNDPTHQLLPVVGEQHVVAVTVRNW